MSIRLLGGDKGKTKISLPHLPLILDITNRLPHILKALSLRSSLTFLWQTQSLPFNEGNVHSIGSSLFS